MEATSGYILLHRKSLGSRCFEDDWLWRLWTWCLLSACYCERESSVGLLRPGQFITRRNIAAGTLGVSPSKWYRGMRKLESLGQIELNSNNQNTTVTICNWEVYQFPNDQLRTTNEQRMNNERTTDEQRADSLQLDKENKGKKEKGNKGSRFRAPSVDEVRSYCHERGNSVDPERFVSYYESNGWKVGRNPMKDWKAAVRTWERNSNDLFRTDHHDASPSRVHAEAGKYANVPTIRAGEDSAAEGTAGDSPAERLEGDGAN